jgi:hypothetical protein
VREHNFHPLLRHFNFLCCFIAFIITSLWALYKSLPLVLSALQHHEYNTGFGLFVPGPEIFFAPHCAPRPGEPGVALCALPFRESVQIGLRHWNVFGGLKIPFEKQPLKNLPTIFRWLLPGKVAPRRGRVE